MADARVVLKRSMIEQAVCPPGASQLILRDAVVPGLVVRILPGGARSFYFLYRPAGAGRAATQRWLKLGAWPALRLTDARAAARIHAGDIARGKDPAQIRAEEKRKSRATLAILLAEGGAYEIHLHGRGLVNIKVALSSLRRGLRAHIAADVAALTRSDIVAAIDELTPGAATDLRKFSHGFLEWAVATGRAPHNVMAGLRMPARTRHQRLLDAEETGRALDDGELVKVWRACETLQDRAMHGEPVSGAFGGLVQLALLTALRRGELAQLERAHILTGARAVDERSGIRGERICLPPSITKTASAHHVPLTAMMKAVLAAQPVTTSKLVFPSSRTAGPLKGWTPLVARLRRDSGVVFSLHDLRRTLRTMMDKLGVPEDIAELCIGHQREDLVGRYNKNQAWSHRIEAFDKVCAHVSALLAEAANACGNVIAMR